MDSFSWADSIRATIGTCVPCLALNADSDDERDQQNRAVGQASAREELERLLDEPMTDHDDVETMSLHSNVGRRAGKTRKKKATIRKSVRVFGVDLFGRRPAPPGGEDDDDNHEQYARRPSGRPRAISTSNLDADAAPLDEALLDFRARAQERWAPPRTDEELAAEEVLERQRAEKELRKAQRRQRKELKRLAEAGAFNTAGNEEFEGFPGSGGGSGAAAEEFGPFVGVAPPVERSTGSTSGHTRVPSDDKDDEDVDFGASEYIKKRRVVDGEGSHSGSGSHSRSRSRTSASMSAEGSQSRMRPTTGAMSGQPARIQAPTRTSSKTPKSPSAAKAKRSKSSVASSSATQSLPSPTLLPSSDVRIHTQEFDGVPGGLLTEQDRVGVINKAAFPSPALPSTGFPSAGFPSTGFGNSRRTTSGLSGGAGVVLARRGD